MLFPSWGKLWPSWGQLGAKLRPSWAKLGPSCAEVGAKLGQVGSKNRLLEGLGAQEPPKATQDRFKPENRSKKPPLQAPCWEAFWAMLASKSHQKATQKAYKTLIDLDVHFSLILDRFWMCFGRVLDAMLAFKMHHNLSFNFERFLDRFFIDFCSKLTP